MWTQLYNTIMFIFLNNDRVYIVDTLHYLWGWTWKSFSSPADWAFILVLYVLHLRIQSTLFVSKCTVQYRLDSATLLHRMGWTRGAFGSGFSQKFNCYSAVWILILLFGCDGKENVRKFMQMSYVKLFFCVWKKNGESNGKNCRNCWAQNCIEVSLSFSFSLWFLFLFTVPKNQTKVKNNMLKVVLMFPLVFPLIQDTTGLP